MVKTYNKVFLRRDKAPKPRLAVEILMTDDKYTEQRDLFLRGLKALQEKDPEDPTSYYRIATIHGLPYEPYDGVAGTFNVDDNPKGQSGGYCHHGDILFPTWHRPYVLLLEQCIYDEAKKLVEADSKSDGYENDSRYVQALEDLRFPYWDWAGPTTLAYGIPAFLSKDTLTVALSVDTSEEDNPKKLGEIVNPLKAYTLPKNLGTMILVGDQGNPTQRPYKPPSENPYTPAGYATVRYPDENYSSKHSEASLKVIQHCTTVFRPNIYQVFLVDDWLKFSSHGWNADPDHKEINSYGHFSSIEVVHDTVHLAVGGHGGHMANPEIAAFDPIFFLHHCNVDRFFAIWQALHPEVWVAESDQTAGTFTASADVKINAQTPLTPFRKSDKENEFLNSDDVSNTHWQVQIRVKKHQLGYPFTIRVFLDHKNANASTSISSPNYAGSMYIFARGKNTQCANCKNHPDQVVNGSVDLYNSMQGLDLIGSETELKGDRITLVAVTQDGKGIDLNKIGLVSADLFKIGTDEKNAKDFNYKLVDHINIPRKLSPSRS
ncbi:hypothetical protein RclHR1_01680024 [Rhizophagus clarus]|uniref:tyrosinase n=1 Tax=Rhizophagus clarus TaxID=94130 RepID=A0A2Z6QID9_9GLOM|nr:hypothetical protein RclHR1_01680024 [Rhizophagus clarus]